MTDPHSWWPLQLVLNSVGPQPPLIGPNAPHPAPLSSSHKARSQDIRKSWGQLAARPERTGDGQGHGGSCQPRARPNVWAKGGGDSRGPTEPPGLHPQEGSSCIPCLWATPARSGRTSIPAGARIRSRSLSCTHPSPGA